MNVACRAMVEVSANRNAGHLASALVASKGARDNLECAVLSIEPFLKSSDERIAQVASLVKQNYQLLGEVLERREVIINGLAQHSKRVSSEDVATVKHDIEATANALMGTLASGVIVIQHPTQPMTLVITGAERRLLEAQLESEFGPGVKKGLKGCQEQACLAGTVIYSVLVRKDVRSSDAGVKTKTK